MFNAVLVQCLQQLDARSRSRFRKFVDAPYFNADPKMRILIRFIYDHLGDTGLSREMLDAMIYPSQPFDYSRITNLLSDLKKLFEQFLIWEELKNQPEEQSYRLLAAARSRGFEKLFNQTNRKLERGEKQVLFETESHYLRQHLIADERYIFFTGKDLRKPDLSLERKMRMGNYYYVSSMLKSACQLLNQQNILEGRGEFSVLEEFISYIRQHYHVYDDSQFIQLYYAVLMTLLEADQPTHYFSLKELLANEEGAIPADERKALYQYAQNYCIKQANRGNRVFLEELFALYKIMIEQEIIYYQGYISRNDVKNIVTLGVRLKEFEWTAYFLDGFGEKISPEQKENALLYNRAYLLYGQGERRAAMRLLNQAVLDDVFYLLGAKTLLIKIYYEIGDDEALEALLHSFSTSIRRTRILSQYQRMVYKNLIRFVRSLYQLRNRLVSLSDQEGQDQIQQLKQKIHNRRQVANIDWLLTSVDTLSSSRTM